MDSVVVWVAHPVIVVARGIVLGNIVSVASGDGWPLSKIVHGIIMRVRHSIIMITRSIVFADIISVASGDGWPLSIVKRFDINS